MDGAQAKLPAIPPVERTFEPHRLKEQIMTQAYEHLLPVICRKLKLPRCPSAAAQRRRAAGGEA